MKLILSIVLLLLIGLLFGKERDGSFNSSINAIYQSMFGKDLYETREQAVAVGNEYLEKIKKIKR